MPVRIHLKVPPVSRRKSRKHIALPVWSLVIAVGGLFLLQPLAAKTKPIPALDPGYVPALTAANHLLQAWQSADAERGMILLTTHAKQAASTGGVERFFSDSGPSAYEISRGKLLKAGRYEFPVVLILGGSKAQTRRRFSTIVVVNAGHNEWAIDKLP